MFTPSVATARAASLAVLLATTALVPIGARAQQSEAPASPVTAPHAGTPAPATPPAPAVSQAPATPAQPAVGQNAPDTTTPASEPTTPITPGTEPIPPVVVEAPRPRPLPPRPTQPAATQQTVPVPAPQPAVVTPAVNPVGAAAANAVPLVERFQLPNTTATITAEQIEQRINIIDTEDAVKYLPSLFVRKRNAGDNQAVLASRVWGLNSSARTLIYVDDILISNLQGNNNSNASPRWGMVAPEEIKRIDFLYGPFAAMYPGNSMGGVLQITTRMPDKFEATVKQSESLQTFGFYNTKGNYRTDQTSASIGNRWNDLSAFVSVNYQNSYSQPLGWATTANALPAGTTGVIPQLSRTGGVANVMGATGLLHTEMVNVKGKVAIDITPWMRRDLHGRPLVERPAIARAELPERCGR